MKTMKTVKVRDKYSDNVSLIKQLTEAISERRKVRLGIHPRNGRLCLQGSQQERG